MSNKTFYYARVSSANQNEDRQMEAFKSMGADERDVIVDKVSGKDLNRTGYLALRDTMLREGDTLVVKELDRLSRNKADLKKELQYYKEKKITVKILDIPTTMIEFPPGQEWIKEMVDNILIEVIGSIAEEERRKIKRRQREGIEAARKKGTKFGRKSIDKPSNWDEVMERLKNGEISKVEAMKSLGLKKTTFYRIYKEL